MFYVGTVRSNRLKGVTLKTEKELKKEGRGTSDSQVEEREKLIVVRWYDNKSVDILSSYVGVNPQDQVRRWDKASKSHVQVNRPSIIEEYNKFMGGIDLLDSLTSLYKQKIKSRRWYMYIFWHTLMVASVNSWLWYRRHCKLLQENKTMSFYTFISFIASGLIEVKAKVGRPLSNTPPQNKRALAVKRPVDDVRTDGDSHLPQWKEKRQRCKMNNCERLSYISCLKCGIHLCLNKDRNCFLDFH